MPEINLEAEPKLMRSPVSRGLFKAKAEPLPPVDRTGGKFQAGLIRGVSVITRGEALGHRMWVDAEMLSQVAQHINAAKEFGVKSRFAHPDMSGDGIGKQTAKTFDARVEGDQVVADWHALQSAHNTPDGDLAGYVMNLADEAPEDFGTSISFQHDRESEEQFELDNMTEVDAVDHRGQPTKVKVFRSPDPLNTLHYPHVRLKEIFAVDVVDEPAANPNGLFHRSAFDLLESGDAALSYVFGLSEEAPKLPNLGIDATRLRGFVLRFCQSRGVTFSTKEKTQMADEKPTDSKDEKPAETKPADKPPTELKSDPPIDTEKLSKDAADKARAEERQRSTDIHALCSQAAKPELAAKFVEEGLSKEDVQSRLFSALCNERPPVGPDAPKPAEPAANAENAKYIAEYKANPHFAKSGMTEDEYVASRRIDDNVDVLKAGSTKK